MLLILFASLAARAVNGCAENSMVFVWSPPFPQLDLPPSAVASNPSFEVTSSPHSPSEQVTRPAVAMVTSHNQSQDQGEGERREEGEAGLQSQGRLNHIQHQLGCTQAISFSVQHFCNTRFNHLAAILLNAVYQGKGRNAWPQLRIAWLTACSGEQSLRYQLLWVSCRCTQAIWLLTHWQCSQPKGESM